VLIRVLVSENQPGDADRIVAGLGEAGDVQVVGLTRDGLETVQMIAQLHPDVALVRAQMPGMDGFQVCRLATLASPGTACVLVGEGGNAEETLGREAMRSGARAVISLQADMGQLLRLVSDLAAMAPGLDNPELKLVSDPERVPFTVAVTGAKGGIGKTTTTTNLSVALAKRFPDQVVVVDFVGHYADINLLLDLPSNGSILELADYEEVDDALVMSRLSRHDSSLRVLAGVNSAASMEAPGAVSLATVANLLGVLRRRFRIIVFDIPAVVYPLSEYVFLRSNLILTISVLADLSTIRSTGSLLSSLIGPHIPSERVKLIVNRADPTDAFGVADLEQAAKHPVAMQIPRSNEVVLGALNSGVPFVIGRPNTPVARAIEKLADMVVDAIPKAASPKNQQTA
jgi:pilus assembly protein CpaE